MDNSRPFLTDDLTVCAFHPEQPSIGWRDLKSADGGPINTIGVCAGCAVDLGAVNGPVAGAVVLLAKGEPCRCGPGFCASTARLGHFGVCAGSRTEPAPDCARCNAPHQSSAGCWICCDEEEDWARANSQAWARCARAGVSGDLVFAIQEGTTLTFDEAVDAAIRTHAMATTNKE